MLLDSPQGQHHQPAFIKVNAVEAQQVYVNPQAAGPSYTSQPIPTPAPTVYNYVNPLNGEQIVSLLPPNHPEMVCLQAGGHVTETNYGILGKHSSAGAAITVTSLLLRYSGSSILVPIRDWSLPS